MTSSLQLNLNDPQNLVARRTTALPGVVHAFGPDDWVQQTSTARLAAHMGIVQALCITQVDATTGLASFISVARKRARPTFTTRDRQLLQLASAHLGPRWNSVWRRLWTATGMGFPKRAEGSPAMSQVC